MPRISLREIRGIARHESGIGIPAIAVVSSSSQGADATGGDENKPTQTNPVTTIVPISAAP